MARPHAAPSRFARSLVALALPCALAGLWGCKTTPAPTEPPRPVPPSAVQAPDAEETVQTLTDEIDALETLNQLELDPDQVPRIVEALQVAESARGKRLAEKDRLRDQLIPAMEEHKQLLLKDEAIPATLSAKIAKLQHDIVRLDTIDPEVSATLAEALRKVLTKEQVLIAAGGLQARIQATETVDGFRDLPKQAFEAEIGPYSQELAAGSSGTSPEQVEALFRDAISLADREYERNREKIVRQLQPLFVPSGQTADQLLVDAFTRPRLLALLQQRMAK